MGNKQNLNLLLAYLNMYLKATKKDIALSKRIKKLRKTVGLTQENLAERVNVSTTHIGLVETGKRRMSLKTLQKVASALQVKVKDIFPF